jgi:hypothetical protein
MADVDLANMALARLGEDSISALGDTTRRAILANRFFEQTKESTLQAHPWKEALVYDILYAYTEPSGTVTPGAGATVVDTTGVTFTASGTPFLAAHATDGWRIWGDGVAGKATITGFTSTAIVTATIDEAFADTSAIATGSWRLYTPEPAFDWDFMIARPTGMLKVWRINEESDSSTSFGRLEAKYARVGSYLFTNTDELEVEYITDLATTSFGPLLIDAFTAHLAAVIAVPLAKGQERADAMWRLYREILQEARTATDQEATPEEFESNTLIDVRY